MEDVDIQSTVESPEASQRFLSPVLRISLLLGVCVHLAGFLIFRVVSNPLPSKEASRPFVQFVPPETLAIGAELEEQAALFDTAPLFIPGEWNAAHNLMVPRRDRGLQRFPSYDPDINLSESLVPEGTSLGQDYLVREPVDVLNSRFWDLFKGIELGEDETVALEPTGLFAEIRSLDGRYAEVKSVDVDWVGISAIQPAKYFLRVEAGGRSLGRPTLSESSGDESFDTNAYDWISKSGIAAGLSPGFFEIRIYP